MISQLILTVYKWFNFDFSQLHKQRDSIDFSEWKQSEQWEHGDGVGDYYMRSCAVVLHIGSNVLCLIFGD